MIRNWFANLSLRIKLVTLFVATATATVLCATIPKTVYDARLAMNDQHMFLGTLANVVANNSLAAVAFSDRDVATVALESLETVPSVEHASLYLDNGDLLATFDRNSPGEKLTGRVEDQPVGIQTGDGYLSVTNRLEDEDGLVGYIHLKANLNQLRERRNNQLFASVLIVVGTSAISLLLASFFQRLISIPIQRLSTTAKEIQERSDYSIRASSSSKDEVGQLCDSFNEMIAKVERNQNELKQAKKALEQRVANRTEELTAANRQLTEEIDEHKKARIKLHQMQNELVESARAVGMADVATGVLHNVGNVLNSVNVTVTRLCEQNNQLAIRMADLVRLYELFDENRADLGQFFQTNRKGVAALEFLNLTGQEAQKEVSLFASEFIGLRKHIDHIKEIVSLQQSLAKVSGVSVEVRFSELFREAIHFNESGIQRHNIEIVTNYKCDPVFASDKHRILQILINLISNAKHAVLAERATERKISLGIERQSADKVTAFVGDNGVGIDSPNREKIFSFGFTTRKSGHGFGLHTSALAAAELGGELSVESGGKGLGATFMLTLPIKMPQPQQQ